MKTKSLLFCCAFSINANVHTAKAQVNVQDSLALVDLYNSTNGPNWNNHTNWLTSSPVSTWYGITVTNNRVTEIYLFGNNLKGSIPSSLGNLINLTGLHLFGNKLNGSIPFSIGDLTNLTQLSLNNNQFSGSIPSSIGNLKGVLYLNLGHNRLSSIPSSIGNLANDIEELYLDYNHFTFEGMELIAKTFSSKAQYDPQKNIPVHQHGNTLSVSAGGTLSNNTYKWFKCDGPGTAPILVATIKGDSVFHPKENGKYRAVVSNSVATQLKLFTKLYDYTVPNNTLVASDKNALHQFGIANAFRVYPNPAKDILRVETNGSATFSLINQSGKILLTTNINGKGVINISGITSGLYYLKNNSTGKIEKVIIER